MAVITPKDHHDQDFQARRVKQKFHQRLRLTVCRARKEPSITFVCTDVEIQVVDKVHIHQVLFHANSTTRVPKLVDDLKAGEENVYEFRALVGAGSRKDVGGFWAAFKLFRDWLYTGQYINAEIEATHLEAYILAEKLQSPRFANAVMTVILRAIRSTKYDGTLASNVQFLFANTAPKSLVRKLYLDTANFWYPIYRFGTNWRGGGILNPRNQEAINVLKFYRREICRCNFPARFQRMATLSDQIRNKPFVSNRFCHCEPWLDLPERFFLVG